MLKNVAIPLMLAASEAEAQRKPTAGDLDQAMRGDRAKVFDGLQADAAACTVLTSVSADNIANLAQAVTEAATKLASAEGAVADAKKDTGAWGKANIARKTAVEAAVAEEAKKAIADLLDDLDKKAEAEREAASKYLDADKLYQEGLRTKATAV